VGDFAASTLMWGTAWAAVLFGLSVWWGTAVFRKEQA
jgi:ABC-2 type transport system permease protein